MSELEDEIKHILAKHTEIKKDLQKLRELGLPSESKGIKNAEGGSNSPTQTNLSFWKLGLERTR